MRTCLCPRQGFSCEDGARRWNRRCAHQPAGLRDTVTRPWRKLNQIPHRGVPVGLAAGGDTIASQRPIQVVVQSARHARELLQTQRDATHSLEADSLKSFLARVANHPVVARTTKSSSPGRLKGVAEALRVCTAGDPIVSAQRSAGRAARANFTADATAAIPRWGARRMSADQTHMCSSNEDNSVTSSFSPFFSQLC